MGSFRRQLERVFPMKTALPSSGRPFAEAKEAIGGYWIIRACERGCNGVSDIPA